MYTYVVWFGNSERNWLRTTRSELARLVHRGNKEFVESHSIDRCILPNFWSIYNVCSMIFMIYVSLHPISISNIPA